MNIDKLFEQYKKWKDNVAEQAAVDASEDENIEIKMFSKYIGKKLDYDIMCELDNLYDEYLIDLNTFDE